MVRFNEKFAVRAARTENLHRPVTVKADRLRDLLCHREQRHVGQQLTLAYDRKQLILDRMVPVDAFVRDLVHRLRFFRSLDPLPADGKLLAWTGTKAGHLARLRDYLHMVCYSAGLPTDIVPHQMRHTYGTEMLRAGVGFAAVMKLLGHTSPRMTMRYLDVTLTDLQRELQLARAKPRHLAPQPKASLAPLRKGRDGLIDSLLATQHVMEMFRRSLPNGSNRNRLLRLSKRLIKLIAEIKKLPST